MGAADPPGGVGRHPPAPPPGLRTPPGPKDSLGGHPKDIVTLRRDPRIRASSDLSLTEVSTPVLTPLPLVWPPPPAATRRHPPPPASHHRPPFTLSRRWKSHRKGGWRENNPILNHQNITKQTHRIVLSCVSSRREHLLMSFRLGFILSPLAASSPLAK
jgi:hypothetical protein